jgi:DNA primase
MERGLILVEGFFAVLALYQAGFDTVVASMGCELSDRQVELLSAYPEVVLLLDGDDAGRAATEAAKAKLGGRVTVRAVRLPLGVKPDELSVRALRWLINGIQLLDLEELEYRPRPTAT